MLPWWSRARPPAAASDDAVEHALLRTLEQAGFPPDELQAVRQTPEMWQQLLQFQARGGQLAHVAADFSAANGHPERILFYVPGDPAQRIHSRYSTLAHELGHALFHLEQWQPISQFASAEAYARSRELGEAHAWLNQYELCLVKQGGRSELYFPLRIENPDDFGVQVRDVFMEIARMKLAGERREAILEHLAQLNANMFPSGMGAGNRKTYGQCNRWDYALQQGEQGLPQAFARLAGRAASTDEQKLLTKFSLQPEELLQRLADAGSGDPLQAWMLHDANTDPRA